jgi:hypothetical protein
MLSNDVANHCLQAPGNLLARASNNEAMDQVSPSVSRRGPNVATEHADHGQWWRTGATISQAKGFSTKTGFDPPARARRDLRGWADGWCTYDVSIHAPATDANINGTPCSHRFVTAGRGEAFVGLERRALIGV